MTWRELRDAIDKMDASQLDKEAKCWREDQPLVNVTLEQSSEAQYYNQDWDYCHLESEIDEDDLNDESTIKVIDEDDYYLWGE